MCGYPPPPPFRAPAEAAIGLLNCETVSLPQSGLSSLDGLADYAPPPALMSQLVRVLLLASDPYFVCFAGQHTLAGGLAVLALVAYVTLLPLVTLYWLWRSPELKSRQQHAPQKQAQLRRTFSWRTRKVAAEVPHAPPPAEPGSAATEGAPAEQPPAPPDAMLAPFLGDSGYASRFWWWRHVDLGAMLVLAVNQAALPRPSTVPLIVSRVVFCGSRRRGRSLLALLPPLTPQVLKASIICAVVLPLCAMVFVRPPRSSPFVLALR